MAFSKRKFIPTPIGVSTRERLGTSAAWSKELLVGHRLASSQSLYRRDLLGHFGCVNAIEFSSDGELIASGGDDRRLLLWNIGQTIFDDKVPHVIDTLHISNINSCCFDADNKKVSTGGNDGQVIVHDLNVRQSTAVYGLSDAVYCLSPDPINATIIAAATDDGKAHILDLRMSIDTAPFVLADLSSAMHSIMYNPAEPRLLATANSKDGIGLWDIRMPLKCVQYKSNIQNCMSVRFNSRGDQLLALRRRSSPVLYDIGKMHPIYEFDYKTYYNACTLKSCSFAGLKDEYVMSGSDDFCIYLWKVPTDISESYIQSEPHMVLKSHRSIVNQVRYCPVNQAIISSGVEKLIKMWSPYYIPGCTGHLTHSRRYGDDDEVERNAYSHEEYIHMVLQAGSFLSHDYTNGSTDEEPCMIAFFDSLIQREIEQNIEEEEDPGSPSDDSSSDDGGGGGQGEVRSGGGGQGEGRSGGRGQGEGRSGGRGQGEVRSGVTRGVSSLPRVNGATDSEERNNTRDTAVSSSSQLEDSSRPFYLDLESSSDSEGEVDIILSAMYSRYMTARERSIGTSLRPSGKKISYVIAKGKQKENPLEKKTRPKKVHGKHKKMQHSSDLFLRENTANMNILVDVIDNFVDDLVARESSNSHTLSDTNDGHVSTDSGSTNVRRTTPVEVVQVSPHNDTSDGHVSTDSGSTREGTPVEVVQQTITLNIDDASSDSYSAPFQSFSRQSTMADDHIHDATTTLESGMYFMPELQAFAPESFIAISNLNLPPGRADNLTPASSQDHSFPSGHQDSLRSGPSLNIAQNGRIGASNSSSLNETVTISSTSLNTSAGRSGDRSGGSRTSVGRSGGSSTSVGRSGGSSTSVGRSVGRSVGSSSTSINTSAGRSAGCSSRTSVSHTPSIDRHTSSSDYTAITPLQTVSLAAPNSVSSCRTLRQDAALTANKYTDASQNGHFILAATSLKDDGHPARCDSGYKKALTKVNYSSNSSSSCVPAGSSSRNFGSASSSSTETSRIGRETNSLKHSAPSCQTKPGVDSGKPVSVQFKKVKVAGKRFRVRQSKSRSSSDEDK